MQTLRSLFLVALLTSFALLSRAQQIPNPSFESNTFTVWPGYASSNGGVINGWTVSNPDGVGLNLSGGSPFADNGAIPDGANVAFIQSSGSTGSVTNSLSTTITGLTPGKAYLVSFRANCRTLYADPNPSWSLNDGPFVPFTASPAVGGSNPYYTQMGDEIQRARAEVQVREPLPTVLGNERLINQVLTNLLSNALKFVAPGVAPKILIRGEVRDSTARLWVEDNGIGIAGDYQKRIFGVFQRLHTTEEFPGTGVGLAIIRRAAERMGGAIGVESVPGEGSRFWIELPRPV